MYVSAYVFGGPLRKLVAVVGLWSQDGSLISTFTYDGGHRTGE